MTFNYTFLPSTANRTLKLYSIDNNMKLFLISTVLSTCMKMW